MMKGTSPKEIRYQHARFLKEPGKTLQQHLDAARTRLKFASQRAQKLSEDEDNVRLWNKRSARGLLTCGMFHSYERGRSQLVIEMQESAEEYRLEAADPPKAKGKNSKTEFNEGLLFFGVHKNHVLLLQSSILRQSAFDDYVNWLLQDATDEIAKDNRIELQDTLPKKLRERNVPPLKSIIFTPPLHAEPARGTEAHGDARTQVRDLSLRLGQHDWSWMRSMLEGMGADVPQNLRLDGDFKPENVQVEIHLRWKGRDKNRAETPVLDTILRAFRDVDDPPIKAVTASGAEIRGNELRLKKKVQIAVDGKIPLASDVFAQMQAYMTELLASGEILAE
jgi:hypothetical protein